MTAIDTPRAPPDALPLLALLAGGIVMGFSPVFVRLSDLHPIVSGVHRLVLAFPVLWLAYRFGQGSAAPSAIARRDWAMLVAAGLLFAADIAFWHMAIALSTVADATLLASIGPVFVTIVAIAVFGERFGGRFFAGLAVALAGVAALALQKPQGAEPVDRLLGDALAVAAALTYAIYILLVGQLRRRLPAGRIIVWTTGLSALALAPFALLTGAPLLPGTAMSWLPLLGMALVSHAGGQSCLTYALAHLSASFTAVSQLMQAGVAALAAWALFGEDLTWAKAASAAAILLGIWLCRRASAA